MAQQAQCARVMLHKAYAPARDVEVTARLLPALTSSASELFEAALRFEFMLEASAAGAERGRSAAENVEVERRLAEAHHTLHRIVTAQLSVHVREAMLLAVMPRLCADLSASGLRQPSWRSLRKAEHVLRRRFEHALARLEQRRPPAWQLRRFIAAGKLLLEVGFVPEPRLARLNLLVVDAGLRALVHEVGLDAGEAS